jgi:hypothetical protein
MHRPPSALCLATGERQQEAVALYESSGWARVANDRSKYGFRFTKEPVPGPGP